MSEGIKKAATFLSGLDAKTADVLMQRFDPAAAAAVRRELLAMQGVSREDLRRTTAEFVRYRCDTSRKAAPAEERPVVRESGIDTFEPVSGTVAVPPPPTPRPLHSFGTASPRTTYAAPWTVSRTLPGTSQGTLPAAQSNTLPGTRPPLSFPGTSGIPGISATISPSGEESPFAFLYETPARSLVKMLVAEHPQAVALVLAHIPPQTAAELLALFPQPLRIEVVRRLESLEEIDHDVLEVVESSLKKRLEEMFDPQSRRIGPEAVRQILAVCDPKTRAAILAERQQPTEPVHGLDETLSPAAPEFEDLEHMDDGELGILFASVDRRIGMIALVGASPNLIERVVGRYTPAQQRKLRQELAAVSPIRPEDIREARTIVLHEAARILT